MKIATIIARSLLGVIFVVFGSNMFLHFIPMPPPPEGPARDFMTALFVSHHLYVIGALQLAGGLLLLAGRWAPLGLTLLGPIIVNILAFHVFMSPEAWEWPLWSRRWRFSWFGVIAKTSPDLCGRRNLGGVKSQLWMSGLNRLQPPTVNRPSWTRLRVP